MAQASKIATCCYCGTRAALVLSGDARHELACSNCGAPLHNLKQMPSPAPNTAPAHYSHPIHTQKTKKVSSKKPAKKDRRAASFWEEQPRRSAKKSKKKRGKRAKDWFEDVFDVIEDIFD